MHAPRAFALLFVALAVAGCLEPLQTVSAPRTGAPAATPPTGPSSATPPVASVTPTPAAPDASGVLEVHYVDVGQGDGVVVRLPSGAILVLDCGPAARDAASNPVVQHLRAMGVREGDELWALVASHGHLDHVGGCDEVFGTHRVRHVYEAWYDGTDRPRSYEGFQDLVGTEGATVHTRAPTDVLPAEVTFAPGDALALPDADVAAGVRATLLGPDAMPTRWDDIATASLVVRLAFGATSFCFQGDIELAQERALARSPLAAPCDVHLAGHHGSAQASDPSWIARLDPEVAVVSFGANSYGHPTSAAMCTLQAEGAMLYATHRAGTVSLASDGRAVSVLRGTHETRDYCAPGASYWS